MFMVPGLVPVLPSGRFTKNVYISPGSGSLVGDKTHFRCVFLKKIIALCSLNKKVLNEKFISNPGSLSFDGHQVLE
jgi:hypothetical protein